MPLPVWAAHKAFRQADVKADEPSLPSQPKPLPPSHPPLPDPSPPPPLPTPEIPWQMPPSAPPPSAYPSPESPQHVLRAPAARLSEPPPTPPPTPPPRLPGRLALPRALLAVGAVIGALLAVGAVIGPWYPLRILKRTYSWEAPLMEASAGPPRDAGKPQATLAGPRGVAGVDACNLDDDNGDSVHLTLIEGVKGTSPETSSARRKARSLVAYRLPRPATGKHGRAQAGQVFCYEDDSENGIGMVQEASGDTDLD